MPHFTLVIMVINFNTGKGREEKIHDKIEVVVRVALVNTVHRNGPREKCVCT